MMPAAHSRAIQRLLKTELAFTGIIGRDHRRSRLRITFLLVRDFPVRVFVANARVEIDAFGEGRAQGAGDLFRNARIDVAAAGRELDPEVLLRLVVDEAADDG